MSKRNRFFLLGIFFLALFLRLYKISSFPIGFTQDEAGIGYDAYSLLLTGKDMWGETWPLILRSFGDFKMPLYSYIDTPFVWAFGLNEFAVRLPSAILGSLAVLFTFLMVRQVSKNVNLAIFSAFFLAVSPWHMSLSRGAFEANLTTFFIPLGIWAFVKGIKSPGWMVVSALSFGLNLFSYHSARFFTPFFVFITFYLYRKDLIGNTNLNKFFKKYKTSIIIFVFFLVTVIYTIFIGAGRRGLDVTIINPTDKWAVVSESRYEALLAGEHPFFARAFNNKATYITKVFIQNYVSYLSPEFLFTSGVGSWEYGMIPGIGVLYSFELILILISFTTLAKEKKLQGLKLMVVWLLLSPVPAALSKGQRSGTRAAVMMPAIQIVSAYGLVYLLERIKYIKGMVVKKFFVVIFLGIFTISFFGFLEKYVYHAPQRGAVSMSHGTKEVISTLGRVEDSYETVRVGRLMGVPQIWVAFWKQYDPKEYQSASKDWLKYEREGYVSVDQLDQYMLGKYIFGNLYYDRRMNEQGTLFVGMREEFPEDVEPIKTIYDPDGKPAYLFVESKNKL